MLPSAIRWKPDLKKMSGLPSVRAPRSWTAHTTIRGSPPGCTCSTLQSIQASAPSTIGLRVTGDSVQETPSYLSAPERANCRASSSWSSASRLTHSWPDRSTLGQLEDDLPGQSTIMGGSRESEQNDCTVSPTGSPSAIAVTTETPV